MNKTLKKLARSIRPGAHRKVLAAGGVLLAASMSVTAMYIPAQSGLRFAALCRMIPSMLEHFLMTVVILAAGALALRALTGAED